MFSLDKYLLPYQREYAFDDSRYVVVQKARRTGMTFAEALRAIVTRLDKKEDYLYVSHTAELGKPFMAYVLAWGEILNLVTGQTIVDLTSAKSESVRLFNGSVIKTKSSNAEGLRGEGGSVCLDEFAFSTNPQELLAAALPLATFGGSVRIISTQSFAGTEFDKICAIAKQGKGIWKLFSLDLHEAIRQGYHLVVPGSHREAADPAQAFLEATRAACGSEQLFNQEFLCRPISSGSAVVPPEIARKLAKEKLSDTIPDNCNEVFVGIDVARSHDLTVAWAIDRIPAEGTEGYKYRTVAVKTMSNVSIADQSSELIKFLNNTAVVGCSIDRGVFGLAIYETLAEQYGAMIEPIAFGTLMKQTLAEHSRKFAAQKRISLPLDENIISDITAMSAKVSPNGIAQYEGSTSFSHCDYFWALSLALHSGETAKISTSFSF